MPESQNAEPDPIIIASICERAGAHGITAHLRADRRHIQTRDIERLRANVMTKLNLEMGNTPEIVDVALRIVPDEVCLVPEKREEITTEGGLDLIAHRRELGPDGETAALGRHSREHVYRSGARTNRCRDRIGGRHRGTAHRKTGQRVHRKVRQTGTRTFARSRVARGNLKLQVNAGHGINYRNIALIHKIPHLTELNIGHSIVARSVFVGFETAVREMLAAMENYKG